MSIEVSLGIAWSLFAVPRQRKGSSRVERIVPIFIGTKTGEYKFSGQTYRSPPNPLYASRIRRSSDSVRYDSQGRIIRHDRGDQLDVEG